MAMAMAMTIGNDDDSITIYLRSNIHELHCRTKSDEKNPFNETAHMYDRSSVVSAQAQATRHINIERNQMF